MSALAIALFTFVVLCRPAVDAQPLASSTTVLDGAYSDAQAARGRGSYTAVCSGCHGAALDGVSAPALTGNRFFDRWREDTLDRLYDFLRESMPPRRPANAVPIPDKNYLDILTYILKMNGYPSGASDLTPALLGSVMLVGKNGPQPVPDGALVLTAGCLSQASDGGWRLERATEPARTRKSTSSTPAELRASSQKAPGRLSFGLTDLEAVPDFAPEWHRGQKVQAKGYLIRQPNAERISLSALEMIDPACGP